MKAMRLGALVLSGAMAFTTVFGSMPSKLNVLAAEDLAYSGMDDQEYPDDSFTPDAVLDSLSEEVSEATEGELTEDHSIGDPEKGSVNRVEYSNFPNFIKGKTKITVASGEILEINGYGSGSTSDSRPLIINQAITFEGNADGTSKVTINPGGIVLGADVTFKNVTLSFPNSDRNAIMANGRTLTLDNVTYDDSAQYINLFCGGLVGTTGYSNFTLPTAGSHGKIVIKNGGTLGALPSDRGRANIYAGNCIESADGLQIPFNGDASVIVEGMKNSNYLGNVYSTGALRQPGNGIDFNFKKVSAPEPAAGSGVTGRVEYSINGSSVNNVDGNQGNNRYASVKFDSGDMYLNGNVVLNNISSLNVNSGYLELDRLSFGSSDSSAVTVNTGARLGLNKVKNSSGTSVETNVVLGSFNGGGEITLNRTQLLRISKAVTGRTQVSIEGTPTVGQKYIQTPASAAKTSFVLKTSSDTYGLVPVASEGGNSYYWEYNKKQDEEEEVLPKITSFTFPQKSVSFTKSQINTLQGGEIPFNFTLDQEVDYPMLYDYPLKVDVVKDGKFYSSIGNVDDGYSVSQLGLYFEVLPRDNEQEFYIHVRKDEKEIASGVYTMTFYIEKDQNRTGDALSGAVTVTVTESQSDPQGNDIRVTSPQGNFSNIVVYVGFSDTTHSNHNDTTQTCFIDNPNIETLFDGDNNPRSLTQYLKTISYGELVVSNIFPKYDNGTGRILPIQLNNNAKYYASNMDVMVQDVLKQLISSKAIPSTVNLDKDGDGCIDNLTIVVPSDNGSSGKDIFIAQKRSYAGSEKMNNKLCRSYNIITENGAYHYVYESGQVIHEFMHTIGYPDLYVRNESGVAGSAVPVYTWDIMSSENRRVQYPLAYFRSSVSGWIDIPTVTESKTGYRIIAPTASTKATRNSQAVILKTPYSDSEFFVVEYRKKSSDTYSNKDYDVQIPGSGLVIYRINTNSRSNMNLKDKDPYHAYVFRTGDDMGTNGREKAGGDFINSFLSAESKRTSYGSSDPKAAVKDGAITYSDGTNSGIVISNVGSASGDSITFDVSFTMDQSTLDEYWKTVSTYTIGEDAILYDSCTAADGTKYFLVKENNSVKVLQYRNNAFSTFGKVYSSNGYDYNIETYNGNVYVAIAKDPSGSLMKVTSSGWSSVGTIPQSNEVRLASDETGLYIGILGESDSKAQVLKFSGSGSPASIGKPVSFSMGAANLSMDARGGEIVIAFREAFQNDKLVTYIYRNGSWTEIGGDLQGGSSRIFLDEGRVYLLKTASSSWSANPDKRSILFSCDKKASSPVWSAELNDQFAQESVVESDMVFVDGAPFVAYSGGGTHKAYLKKIENGKWTMVGNEISPTDVLNLKLDIAGSDFRASYAAGGSIFIRTHNGEGGEVSKDRVRVYFDAQGGEILGESSLSVTKGGKYGVLPDAVKAKNIFLGWYTQAGGGTAVTKDTIVDLNSPASVTLYARWQEKDTAKAPTARDVKAGTVNSGDGKKEYTIQANSEIELSTATAGAEIYYTLNGRNPSTDSMRYTGKISVAKLIEEGHTDFLTIKAFAVKEDCEDSDVSIFMYNIEGSGSTGDADWGDVLVEDRKGYNSPSDIPEGVWVAGVGEATYTGAAITFPNMRVYSHDVLMRSGTDYTVAYKNNKVVQVKPTARPTITIKTKGNFKGNKVVYFDIVPKKITDSDVDIPDFTLSVNNKVQKPTPAPSWISNGKTVKLKNKTDFTVEYVNNGVDDFKAAGVYSVIVNGRGNYTGSRTISVRITTNILSSSLSVNSIAAQTYTGKEIKPVPEVYYGKTELLKGVARSEYTNGASGVDYVYSYENNVYPGTAYVVLEGKGRFEGIKRVPFSIPGISIAKAKVSGIAKSYGFTGDAIEPSGITLYTTAKVNGVTVTKEFEPGKDYAVDYTKNVSVGTATIIFTGKNECIGTLKKTFKIVALDISKNPGCIEVEDMQGKTLPQTFSYSKGGVKLSVKVFFRAPDSTERVLLSENVDYKLSYANNTAVNDGSNPKKIPMVKIAGKGNFKGTVSRNFMIAGKELSKVNINAADKEYASAKNNYVSTPYISDLDGKALKVGTDYEKTLVYTYVNETVLEDGAVRHAGDTAQDGDIVRAGTVMKVTAQGRGNYTGTVSDVYTVVESDISKATVTIDSQIYTGRAVKPGKDRITVTLGGRVLGNDEYRIISYSNNINKGKGTVTIMGLGKIGGMKSAAFNILIRNVQ